MTSTTEPGTTPAATGHKLAAPADLYHLPDLVTCGPGRPTQDSHSPLDGSLVGAVPVCTPDDVAAAVESARAAQREWAAVPLRERRAVVGRFHALLLQREAEILDLVQAESGKSRLNAFEELADAALTAAYYRRTAGRFLRPGPPHRGGSGPDPDGGVPDPQRRGGHHQPVELPADPRRLGCHPRPAGRQRLRPQA